MLEGIEPRNKDGLCAVMSRAVEKLDADDINILNAALADPKWSNLSLSETLTARGFAIGESAIRRHRNKKCACVR